MLYDSKLPTDSIIKGDLEHIAKNYAAPGFDRPSSPSLPSRS